MATITNNFKEKRWILLLTISPIWITARTKNIPQLLKICRQGPMKAELKNIMMKMTASIALKSKMKTFSLELFSLRS